MGVWRGYIHIPPPPLQYASPGSTLPLVIHSPWSKPIYGHGLNLHITYAAAVSMFRNHLGIKESQLHEIFISHNYAKCL